jgi:hypothetical protein
MGRLAKRCALLLALFTLAASALTARAWLSPASRPAALAGIVHQAAATTAQSQAQAAPLQTELVTITSRGFDPAEITRPRGPFILAVDNRSGLAQVSLSLAVEHARHLKEVRVPREQLDWHGVVDVAPGRYVLTEAEHPDWQFVLTITE